MARDELLAELAQLEKVYAVGRTAIEARALGCEVLPYDPRYPDPDRWKVLDNREAAKILQEKLDAIDGQYQTIIDHTHPVYVAQRDKVGKSRWNGAYYYSIEAVEKIIPNVITNRPWITINIKDPRFGADRAIVFVHNHKQCPQCYEWLKGYKDLIFICSERDDMPKLEYLGTPIYLPLSVDVEFVKKFKKKKKTKGTAFVGRRERARDIADKIPAGTEYVSGLPRKELLTKLADYETVYALDRVAIEAQILGCNVLPYPDRWKVIDSKQAAAMLQAELDKIEPRPMTNKNKKLNNNNEWLEGFPEPNGIYKCLINDEEIKPLMHKKCSINGKHRWMTLDGHDALGKIKYKNKRLSIDEL